MRKILAFLLLMLLMCCPMALADSVLLDEVPAACELDSGKYTVLTRDNLATHFQWLEDHATTVDIVLADWNARGVYAQAWSDSGDVCIEITAVQDEYAATYYDVNKVTSDERKTYRTGHSSDKNGHWRALGYDYTSAEWKNYSGIGRFLQLEYRRTVDGESYRGYARKTIRNGWHIHIDYQVRGRSLKNADRTALEAVMKSWEFQQIIPQSANTSAGASSAAASRSVLFTQIPPRETNTGKFTVTGTGAEGLKIIGVVMRMTDTTANVFEATIGKNGKFEMDVTLPQQGNWLMTYTIKSGETTVTEGVFDPVTYQKSLLTVSLNSDLPATMTLTGNELVISGTTMRQTKVQCYVDERYEKIITTNSSGGFTFTIDTSKEGVYNIALTFQKKGYTDRRIYCVATRTYTAEDLRQVIRDEAIKLTYAKLTGNLSTYRGRYMVYTVHVESVTETETGYMISAGLSKTKSGVYKDMIIIRSTDKPIFQGGDQVKVYLKCLGGHTVDSEGGSTTYPYFDLQFTD